MKGISEIRRENLLRILELKNLNKTDLAKKLNRKIQQVSAITTGYYAIGSKIAREVEKALDLEPFFLDTDRNVEQLESAVNTKRIPMLSWVQAGYPHDTGDNDYSETMIVGEYIPDGCFGLKVRGDSMIPEFKEGDPIIVNPNICKKPGDFVIARVCSVSGDRETTLKQYAVVGIDEYGREIFELRPLNPMYAPLRSDKLQIDIIGVVIENHKKYR